MKNNLTPSFLVAPPALLDEHFKNSVTVLSAHEEKDGSMGFTISNQSPIRFYELLSTLSIKAKVPDKKVLVGGPLQKNTGFILYEHRKNKPVIGGISLCSTISISPAKEILEMAAHGELPGRF